MVNQEPASTNTTETSAAVPTSSANTTFSSPSSPVPSSQTSLESQVSPLTPNLFQSPRMTAHATPNEFRLLERRMGGGPRQLLDARMTDVNIKENLVKLSEEDRVKFRNDVKFDMLQYWELRRFSHPELYKLSQVVLSIPATQVSVERAFSALSLVLSHLRSRMSSETINDCLTKYFFTR